MLTPHHLHETVRQVRQGLQGHPAAGSAGAAGDPNPAQRAAERAQRDQEVHRARRNVHHESRPQQRPSVAAPVPDPVARRDPGWLAVLHAPAPGPGARRGHAFLPDVRAGPDRARVPCAELCAAQACRPAVPDQLGVEAHHDRDHGREGPRARVDYERQVHDLHLVDQESAARLQRGQEVGRGVRVRVQGCHQCVPPPQACRPPEES